MYFLILTNIAKKCMIFLNNILWWVYGSFIQWLKHHTQEITQKEVTANTYAITKVCPQYKMYLWP